MNNFRASWRLLRFGFHLLAGLWVVWFAFPRLSTPQRHTGVQMWARKMLSVLGLQLQVKGQVPESGPVLLVANHISWIDIVVLHAVRHCRFVSKDAVARWPLIATLANAGGTLYITRESRRDALRVMHSMVECLHDGDVLAIFPEGTTGDGQALLPFHANLLQAAIVANAPVHPVALSFIDGQTGARSFAPCYVGSDTLLQSLWRTVRAQHIVAVVHFGDPEYAQGRSRRVWATDLRNIIADMRLI